MDLLIKRPTFMGSLRTRTCHIFSSILFYHHHHHHKHQGLDPLIRSVSRVTAARANASSVFQLFSFLVVCSIIFSFILFCSVLLDIFMICRSSRSRVPFCCHATMQSKAKNLFARLAIGTVPSTRQYPNKS